MFVSVEKVQKWLAYWLTTCMLYFNTCDFAVIVKVKTQKKGVLVEEGKKNFAYGLEQQFRVTPENQITIIFDFTDAGVTNMVGIGLTCHLS